MHSTRPSPATFQQAAHSPGDVSEPFSHAADVSKQSSRSPTTFPQAASRATSPASVYQDALGYLHLRHRTHSQDHKQDCTGHIQHTEHHPRSDRHSAEDIGWKVYCTASFTTALCVVMAELAKQVEVHCSERAHALALTWNLYAAAMDTCQSRKPLLGCFGLHAFSSPATFCWCLALCLNHANMYLSIFTVAKCHKSNPEWYRQGHCSVCGQQHSQIGRTVIYW